MFNVILIIGIALIALGSWSAFRRCKKLDRQFDEIAADSVRRRTAIVTLTRMRTIAYICAAFIGLFALAITYLRHDSSRDSAVAFGVTAIMWAFGHKYESDMRLLSLIDRLDKNEKTDV
ncbi:MAG: hypothetical protein D4R57_00010 [Verrucomicrobiales bacterium]|nr:MAG: hypothetical protein D4R57_00010 [Verrucomicrobiales bacterium]